MVAFLVTVIFHILNIFVSILDIVSTALGLLFPKVYLCIKIVVFFVTYKEGGFRALSCFCVSDPKYSQPPL